MRAAKTALVLLLMAGAASASSQQSWKLASGPLMTRWGKRVSPFTRAGPLHPRPHLMRSKFQLINGIWDYAIRSKDEPQPGPKEWDGKIFVPYPVESALSGVMKRVGARDRLWYRMSGPLPDWSDARTILHFGAVDWDTTVWVNGGKAGSHRGGYDPFSFDITSFLKPSGNQEIIVSVWDPTDSGYQPRGKQVENPHGIWYTPTTGIWQSVWVEAVPASYIEDFRVVPDVDLSEVRFTAKINGPSKDLRIWVSVYEARKIIGTVQGAPGDTLTLTIPQAKLWSPSSPFLYRVNAGITTGKETVDAIRSYFGMRKISVARDRNGVNRIMLNNKPIFNFGLLDQGFWPDGLYTAPSDDALRHDIDMTKALGFNMIRKHVKVEPARWYFWCDWLGILVWQDMPSANVPKDGTGSTLAKENYRRELKAMVDSHIHHPSIVMWVPFNEGWGQHDTEETVEWLKRYDPTRLVNCASGWTDVPGLGDVHDIHAYPGPKTIENEANRAIVLGEFGGLGLPVKGHTWQEKKNWGYQSFENSKALTKAYLKLLKKLRPMIESGLAAAVYTQTTDVEIEVNGLMTYDRQELKVAGQKVTEANRKISESLSTEKK